MKRAILIVDDDEDELVALQATLEPLGLEIVRAESGPEALRLILQRDFALVILDLMMPVMNGFEVCAMIRGRDKCRNLPVIILTGFDEEGARDMPGYKSGTFEFIRKPVPPETLRARTLDCVARAGASP